MKKIMVFVCLVLPSCMLDGAGEMIGGTAIDDMAHNMEGNPGSENGVHCVMEARSAPVGERASDIRTDDRAVRDPACFDTFAEAIEFATNGRVLLSPEALPMDLDEDLLQPSGIASSPYIIAVEYEDANYGGSSLTITNDNDCNDFYHYLEEMPYGWDDVVSSAKTFSGCEHSYHYEHPYRSGVDKDCGKSCSYIGDAMNDNTSSLEWRQ